MSTLKKWIFLEIVGFWKSGYYSEMDIFKKWIFRKTGYLRKMDILSWIFYVKISIVIKYPVFKVNMFKSGYFGSKMKF